MTVSYSDSFVKLLIRWRGSLWKSIWKELLVFLIIYYAINFVYRFALNDEQKMNFGKFVAFCSIATEYIPLLFLLGFYVLLIVDRWWQQFNYVTWPDRFMIFVTTYLHGEAEDLRILRRTVARYCGLVSVLAWREISERIRKRFPTLDHVVKSGLFTEEEKNIYENTKAPYGKYWLPIMWMGNLFRKAYEKGIIDSTILKQLSSELQTFRTGFGMLMCYDWVSVPLVYTQVVTIATYGYFVICLIGRQYPQPKKEGQAYDVSDVDLKIPIFTILQFLFYMGWLKVGEDLMNPFGEDDDDFEMNWILDRNCQIAFMMADDVHGQLPALVKDANWGNKDPIIPHTKASAKVKDIIFDGHLANFKLTDKEMAIVLPDKEGKKLSTQHPPTAETTSTLNTFISNLLKKPTPNSQRAANAALTPSAPALDTDAKQTLLLEDQIKPNKV